MPAWDVEYTDQFEAWWLTLADEEQQGITAAVQLLARDGPALGRPLVDTLAGSRHANMKELRPPGIYIRVLFAFDPRRTAILLIGGNKEGPWQDWYREFIPTADKLYDEHLEELGREGDTR